MPMQERQKLRNQISAQQSRMKKREELNSLVQAQAVRNEQMNRLASLLLDTLGPNSDQIKVLKAKIEDEFSEEILANTHRKKQRTDLSFETVFQNAF